MLHENIFTIFKGLTQGVKK